MEQGTEEWLEIRKGKATASHACEIGNCGKGLDTYILTLMSKYYSSGEREYYTNADMDRGLELEELAANIYALEQDADLVVLEEVGFIEHNEFIGCSPDRLVDHDGLLEIKCPNDKNYFKYLMLGEKAIDSKYLWQMQMQMLITGRKYCDFMAYNPNFKTPFFIHRIFPDPTKRLKLMNGFKIVEGKISGIKSQLGT